MTIIFVLNIPARLLGYPRGREALFSSTDISAQEGWIGSALKKIRRVLRAGRMPRTPSRCSSSTIHREQSGLTLSQPLTAQIWVGQGRVICSVRPSLRQPTIAAFDHRATQPERQQTSYRSARPSRNPPHSLRDSRQHIAALNRRVTRRREGLRHVLHPLVRGGRALPLLHRHSADEAAALCIGRR